MGFRPLDIYVYLEILLVFWDLLFIEFCVNVKPRELDSFVDTSHDIPIYGR